ncbi:hypothetical protein [Legionella impletisoli]|uniref:Uncharacterized protein n=1 Tax=Legionella impletisoli TaxID=343510 RepID=A0A917NBM2_9GAMM|nr:hypothetical protein [Legionella impletisoli]GGI81246.1 hypothetical protein GCM10007966_07180 [Legionella impletisoli]
MQQSQWEVVILKPTSVFRSFLAAQLPEIEIPDLSVFQTDTTAYTILKHDDEEDTLDEIEKHFPTMFRHEISRWLGEDARNDIEGSFLDFLCCFKFELHSQIVLMEPTLQDGHQLVCIKPRAVLLKWMKSAVQEQTDLTTILNTVNLTQISENATVVVKNFNQLTEVKPFLKHYYQPMFKAEMHRMCDETGVWPEVKNYQDFSRYFAVELHTQLVHLH